MKNGSVFQKYKFGVRYFTHWGQHEQRHENCPHQAWPKRVRYFLILELEAQNCMGAFGQVQEAQSRAEAVSRGAGRE